MKIRHTFFAVTLAFTLCAAPVLHAQAPASPSTASGHRSEPEANNADQKKEVEQGSEAFTHSPSVVKLGGMLGMSPETASSAFQWANFLVLAIAVGYGLAKALPKVFLGRSEKIQKDIVEARVATEEARARLSAVEDRLGRLDGEIAAIRADSERDAQAEEARMKQQIEEETKRILVAAEQEIAAASAQAENSLRAYAAELAVDHAAARIQISDEDDRVLIQNFASKLTEGSRN